VKRSLKYRLCAVAAAAAIGVVAAPKLRPLLNASKPPQPALVSHTNATAPLKVSSVVVHTEPFAETVTSTGTLRAEESVDLQAEISGKVVAINFVEGARVRKGDLLVKLNDADLRAGREAAVQREKLAVLQERRLGQLLPEGYVTRGEYDIALNQANVQHAEVALIDAQIEKTEIRAPFDGTVGLRYISDGAYVNVNATTNSPTACRHAAAARQAQDRFRSAGEICGRIRLGDAIRFTVPGGEHALPGRDLRARSAHRQQHAYRRAARAVSEPGAPVDAGCVRQHRAEPEADRRRHPGAGAGDHRRTQRDQCFSSVSDGKATPRAVDSSTRLRALCTSCPG